MSMKKAKMICKLQGITLNIEVTVLCPSCSNKMMKLVIGKNIARCDYCEKEMTVDDVLEIAECDWREKHKKYEKLVKYNKGVGY
jgi:hypothetical protein